VKLRHAFERAIPVSDDSLSPGDGAKPEEAANPDVAPRPVDLTSLNLETLEAFFPSENPNSVTIWFDKATIESLKKIAKRDDLPVGWLIRKVMKEFIDQERK
jgi:hypothetical protein